MFYLFLGYHPSALTPKQMFWTGRLPPESLYPKLGLPREPQSVQTARCVVLILGHCHQMGGEHFVLETQLCCVKLFVAVISYSGLHSY